MASLPYPRCLLSINLWVRGYDRDTIASYALWVRGYGRDAIPSYNMLIKRYARWYCRHALWHERTAVENHLQFISTSLVL